MADDIKQTVIIEASLTKIQSDLKTLENNFASSFGNIKNLATSALGNLGAVLSVGALTGFTSKIFALADSLQNLHERTDISVEFLSGFKSTLEESGTSVDTFANGVFNLQKNLGNIDKATDPAALAIKRLGLNFEELRNISVDDFIKQVTDALAKIENPVERNTVMFTLLGKSAKELGPALAALAGRFDEVKRSGLTAADVKALDDIGDALTRLKNQALLLGAEGVAGILRFFGALRDAPKVAAQLADATKKFAQLSGIPEGRVEGMTSKEIIAAGEKPGFGINPQALRQARDGVLDLREEFDRLNKVNVTKPTAVFKGISDGAKGAKKDVENLADSFLDSLEKQLATIESKKIELRFGTDFALGASLDKQFEDFKEKLREKQLPIPKGIEEFFKSLKERIIAGTDELKRMQHELAKLDALGKAFDQDSQEWGRAIEESAKAAAEALAKIEPAFQDLQKQMAIDILPKDQQDVARANREFEERVKVIREWRDAAIAAGQDVADVNAQAAQATADAWITTYDDIKDKTEETTEFMRTAIERGFGAVSDGIEDFLNGNITSWEDWGKKVLGIINKLLADQITLGLKDMILGPDFGKQGAGIAGGLGSLLDMLGLGKTPQPSRQLPGTTAADRLDAERGQEMRDAASVTLGEGGKSGTEAAAVTAIQATATTGQSAIQSTQSTASGGINALESTATAAIQTTGATAQTSIQALQAAAIAAIQAAAAAASSQGGGGDMGGMEMLFSSSGGATDAGAYSEGGGLVTGMGYHGGGLVTPGGEHATFRRRLPRYHVGGEVNAVLKDGEYVVNDRATGMMGKPALDYINATGRMPDNAKGWTGGKDRAVVVNVYANDAGSFARSRREIQSQVRDTFRRID
jgi:hypothetical protein